jgi:rod shape determining protein RodA
MALIGFQSLINLGMNLRVLPVIGITLPFFSDGGSSVATLYLGIGLILSVSYSERTRKGNSLARL